MIKLKKIVAVALSAAMCLGLSMTTFAASEWSEKMWESENYMRTDIGIGPGGRHDLTGADGSKLFRVTDAKGNNIEYSLSHISTGTWQSINDEGKVHDIFEKAGYEVKDNMDFVPLASGTITMDNGVPEGGATLNFGLADLGVDPSTVKAGDVIYAMQETAPGSGVWEVFPATIVRDSVTGQYQTSVTIPRNGALVIVKVMSNGDIITLDKTTGQVINRVPADGNNSNTNTNVTTTPSGSTGTSSSAAASAGTSPKTGEF